MDLIITILPVVTKDLPISPRFTPYVFLSRCKFSTLTTRQPMVEFYLLTFPSYLKKNQNAPRPSEHPPVMGEKNVKTFRWDQRLQIQNLFVAFKRVPRWR